MLQSETEIVLDKLAAKRLSSPSWREWRMELTLRKLHSKFPENFKDISISKYKTKNHFLFRILKNIRTESVPPEPL